MVVKSAGYITRSLCLSDAVRKSFIMLRDEKFEGPDRRIKEELVRRCMPPTDQMDALYAMINESTSRPLARTRPPGNFTSEQLNKYINMTALRSGPQNPTSNATEEMPIDPQIRMITDLILFLIYSVKQRLEDIRPILDKYEMDERFRLGHIFCTLDRFKTELLSMFLDLYRRKTRSVAGHIIFYEHLWAKNIDITYTVEFLIYIENKQQEELDKMLKQYHASKKDFQRYQEYLNKKLP